LFVILNSSDKNGELGKVRHLTASGLNQSLMFLENDFGLLVFIRPIDGYAIGISRCQTSNVCDSITHNAVRPKLGRWFCFFRASAAGNHFEILSFAFSKIINVLFNVYF
jgi:hypothetical protein